MGLLNRLIVTGLPLVPRPIVRRVAGRYVAGANRRAALEVVAGLNRIGAAATVDLLGEGVTEREPAERAVEEYRAVLEEIASRGLDSNISVKPTQLGLGVSPDLCRTLLERLCEAAAARGNFVRIDMEDRTTTDATLEIYRELHSRHDNVGCVLQARLRRTLTDIDVLPDADANVRICKGIYLEPRSHAWTDPEAIRWSFLAALEKLLARRDYVAIATHDEQLVAAALGLLDRHRVPRDRYEFQVLLGVEEGLRNVLVAAGHRLRVYVPYGRDWYAYSMRRLRENPEVAGHVMRAMWSRR